MFSLSVWWTPAHRLLLSNAFCRPHSFNLQQMPVAILQMNTSLIDIFDILTCCEIAQFIFKRHSRRAELPASETFPPAAFLSKFCKPIYVSVPIPPLGLLWTTSQYWDVALSPVSKPQLVQVCVQLGCQVLLKIKQTRTPVPSMLQKKPKSEIHYASPWFSLSDCQSAGRKIDMFSIMQLQKPSGLISESLRNIWIFHDDEYHFSILIPMSFQNL